MRLYELGHAMMAARSNMAYPISDTKRTLAVLLFCTLCRMLAAQGVMTTFAGTDFVFSGDGKPALSTPFNLPFGVCIDPNGNLVVADFDEGVVVRLNPDGTLSLLAGNGFPGDSGDGGPATSAGISHPVSCAFDPQGNLFISGGSDYFNAGSDIRKVSARDGNITTFAGKFNLLLSGGDGGPAADAPIVVTGNLAADSLGNIYFSDLFEDRVGKIDANGIITAVAGNGASGFGGDGGPATAASLHGPQALAVDRNGNLYIADDSSVRKVTAAGVISTIVPAGTLQESELGSLAVDNSGTVYIGGISTIYKLLPGASVPQLIAGTSQMLGFGGDNGPALNAVLNGLTGFYQVGLVADGNGNLFVSDGANHRVRKIAPNGIITTVVGTSFPVDNLRARSVFLSNPAGLVSDGAGNLYVQDYNRVLKISPAGIVNTFAGTGAQGFSGDNGPATQATLDTRAGYTSGNGVAFYGGNLYIADYGNGRIRQVTPAGIISTYAAVPEPIALAFDNSGNLFVASLGSRAWKIDPARKVSLFAGTGNYGFSGDGGPAVNATFGNLVAVVVDNSGNVYFADIANSRVRVVTPQGIIQTYAGNGTIGDTGDGSPATQATLCLPTSLAIDASGNVYIAQATYGGGILNMCTGLVRVVSQSGIISTFAGGGPLSQLGDGEPATQATLANPASVAFDSNGNLYIGDAFQHRIREVLATPAQMQVDPTNLSFSASSGGAPIAQTVTVKGSITGLNFSVSIDTGGVPNWLVADTTLDATPRLLTLTADPSSLPPGRYTATVTITPVAAIPSPLTVSVNFQVGAPQPPNLELDKPALSFTLSQTSSPLGSPLMISNAGSKTLPYTVTSSAASGGNWLSVAPASGSASPAKPSTVTVTADPDGLAPGTYTGVVSIESAAGSRTVPIILTVSANPQAVLLTQTGLSFTAVAQGGVIPPQSFGVINAGTGSMNWTASPSTTSGGNWLLISPASGVSDNTAAARQISVSVNTAGLAPGVYYGTVRVDAPATANKSRVVTIYLSVLPAGTPLAASVEPPDFVFYASPSGLPGSQVAKVYNVTQTPRSFTLHSFSGLYALPQEGTLDPNQPTRIVVQPDGTAFPAGTNIGTLTFQFDDGTVRSVRTTVIPAPPSSLPGAALRRDQPSCAPSQLAITLNSLGQAFQVSAGWPVGLSVSVTDDCQNPLVSGSGSVWAHFDDGEDDVALTSLGDGTWQGTWKPTRVNPNVTMTLNARRGSLSSQRPISGSLSSANDQPLFTLSSIGSAFPAPVPQIQPLAPGSFLSIYGQRLADYSADSAKGALPTQLGNTTVFFNDLPGAISHADPGQINVVVPYRVNLHTSNQIRVQRGLTLSDPVAVDIADAQPSVLQVNGNAYALDYPADGSTAFPVTPNTPAKAGDVLVMYCVGLGVVDQTLEDGAISPGSPPANVPGVAVNIGDRNAFVQFAGLVPGFVGLYQINTVMPPGVMAGTAQTIVIAGGQASPAVNLTVR